MLSFVTVNVCIFLEKVLCVTCGKLLRLRKCWKTVLLQIHIPKQCGFLSILLISVKHRAVVFTAAIVIFGFVKPITNKCSFSTSNNPNCIFWVDTHPNKLTQWNAYYDLFLHSHLLVIEIHTKPKSKLLRSLIQ